MAGAEGAGAESEGHCGLTGPKDGPVLSLMSKRLRALRKKYNRIVQIEDNKAQGKAINKEQEEVLKTKIAVAALIDEYEKLRQPLSLAVKEELAERETELMVATLRRREDEEDAAEEKGAESNGVKEETSNGSSEEVRRDVEGQSSVVSNCASELSGSEMQDSELSHDKAGIHPLKQEAAEGEETGRENQDKAIGDLLMLLYFSQLFDVKSQREAPSLVWTKVHERSSCLSYDFVTEDSASPLLEGDLDALSLFGSLVTSRPPNATLSHKDALRQCIQHAFFWLHNSDSPIHPDFDITYSHLKERLNRILSSEYFTMTPELQTVSQQTAAAAAAAAGTVAGQYALKVLVHEAPTETGILEAESSTTYYSNQDQAASQQHFESEDNFITSAPLEPASSNLVSSNAHAAGNSAVPVAPKSAAAADEIPQFGSQDDSDQISAREDVAHESEQIPQHQEMASPTQHAQQHQHQERQPQVSDGGVGRWGFQGPKGGGRGMGYGMGGRGRGYVNGRGRGGRGGGYPNGRGGQYHDQGGYYGRNYYGRGGGRGPRGGGMVYNNHTNGSVAATAPTDTV